MFKGILPRRTTRMPRCGRAAALAVALLLLIATVPAARGQYVEPAPDDDLCFLALHVPLPETLIGDITGDGVADRAHGILVPRGERGRVVLIDGATGALIREILAPAALETFGLGVFPVGFGGGAGAQDLAVVSVNAHEQTVITLFSLVSGQPTATIVLPPAGNGTNLTAISMGDVDASGDVSVDDLGMAIQFYQNEAGGPAVAHADFDGDGLVSDDDVWNLAARLGMECQGAVAPEFTAALAAFINPDPADSLPANMLSGGVLECLWCVITCGSALNEAAKCVRDAPNWWDVCMARYDNDCNHLDFSQCVRDTRFATISACLARIGAAAGECQDCVMDCGPQP
ncbi:MAG: hypothetical protein ACKVS8_13010 [Phycisphaerales bacterium]